MTSRSASKLNAPHCHHALIMPSPWPHLAKQGPGDRTKGGTQQQPAAPGAPQAKDTIHPIPWLDRPRKKTYLTDWSLWVDRPQFFGFNKTGVFHVDLSYLRKMIFEKPSGDQKDSCWTWPFNWKTNTVSVIFLRLIRLIKVNYTRFCHFSQQGIQTSFPQSTGIFHRQNPLIFDWKIPILKKNRSKLNFPAGYPLVN